MKKKNGEEKVEEVEKEEVLEEAVLEEKRQDEESKQPEKKKKKEKKNEKPEWVNYEKDEIEKLILKLSQKGSSNSEIGMILRDQYGIPDVKAFGLTVGKALNKHGIKKDIPDDLYRLMRKSVLMRAHIEKNKKDKKNVHRLQLIESRVRKLGRYYSKIGKLPKEWKYDIAKAKLMIK